MADGVVVSEYDRDTAKSAIYASLVSLMPSIKDQVDYHGDIEASINYYGMRAFVDNQVAVKAADLAYIRMLTL